MQYLYENNNLTFTLINMWGDIKLTEEEIDPNHLIPLIFNPQRTWKDGQSKAINSSPINL